MTEPRRGPWLWLAAVLLLLSFLGSLLVIGFRRTTPGTSIWMRESKTSSSTRPAMKDDLRRLRPGMTPAEVEAVMGKPDRRETVTPFETWHYQSRHSRSVRRYLLGILPAGGGSSSESSSVVVVFHDGALASSPYGVPMERRLAGAYARLRGGGPHPRISEGPSAGRPVHDQLCAITRATTEAEVETLLGPPRTKRRQGDKAVWTWEFHWTDGSIAQSQSLHVWFRNGVVVETPYDTLTADEAREFEGSGTWK